MNIVTVLFSLAPLIVFSSAANFPSDVEKCHYGDGQCILERANHIIKSVPGGRPDLGVVKIDPLRINKLVISQGGTSALNLELAFSNIDIIGLSDLVVKKVEGFEKDPTKSKFEFTSISPKITLKGKYKANGRILVLPIQGQGDSEISFDNLEIAVKYKAAVVEKNGKTHHKIDKIKVFLTPSKMSVNLENLFNGDKTLGDNMNNFLNENWRDVWSELSPGIFEAIGEVVKNIFNGVFNKFSYDELFLD